jgi:hypothetical protein
MGGHEISQALGPVEVGFVQGRGQRGGKDEGAVHSPGNAQGNDNAAQSRCLSQYVWRLS